ncbi:hypothetical protein [Anaerobacillus alkaliphilus]|nr:hypothetical protein [Anaerobacillus alkaliphilus]
MELKAAASIEEAEKIVKAVRPEIEIHPEFKNDLKRLYPEQ